MKKGNELPILSTDSVDDEIKKSRAKRGERLKQLRKKHGYTQEAISNCIGVTVKTYRTWEKKCDSYIDELSLIKLASLYSVSIDYITGLSEYTSVDNAEIGNITGLSDTAINNLKCDKEEKKLYNVSHYHHIDILNFLLCDKDGAFLLSSIYDYLFGNYVKTSTGNDTMILLDDTGMPCNGAELFIKDINAYFLASITEKLSQIKGDISKNLNSKYYGKYNPKTATERQELWKDISPLKK